MLNTKQAGAFDKIRRALFTNIPGTPEGPLSHMQRINAFADKAGKQAINPVRPKPSLSTAGATPRRALGVIKVGHLAGQRAALEQLGLSL